MSAIGRKQTFTAASEAVELIEQLENARDLFASAFAEESPKNAAKIKKATVADVFEDEVDDEGDADLATRPTFCWARRLIPQRSVSVIR